MAWYTFPTVTRDVLALVLVGALFWGPDLASAQSEKLLEATRLQRPGALELAQAELTTCVKRSCPDAGRLSLLLGELWLSRGEPAKALAVLRRFPAPAPLAPYRDFALGEALFYLRDYRGAAAHFLEASTAPGVVAGRAEARAGEALLLAHEPGQALPLLEKGLAQVGGPELVSARAEARAQLGDLPGAQADLHTLLVHYPRSPAALEVDAQLRGSSAPAVALTLEERLGRAKAFLEAGDARQALAEVERIDANGLARDAAGKAQLALFRAQALYPLGRAEEGDAALEVAAQGPSATASEALLVRARRMLRLNDNAGALLKFQEVSRKYPGELASEEADYFIGWIALQEGKNLAAAQALEAFEKKHPESHRRDDACWFRALACIRLSNWAEADRALRELVERYPKSSLVPQARYWRARVKHLGGGNAADDYLDIIRTYPASFYALVASERMREVGAKPPPLFAERPRLPTQAQPSPELALPRALAAAGLWREAAEELRSRLGQIHTPEQALRVGSSLALLGEAWAAYGLANRLLWGRAYSQKDPVSLALLYPRPYASQVDDMARTAGVSSGLLYAMMRRESAFQPDRLSGARARGLMQLMARTASAIAKELQREAPEPDELYRPELNLDLSAWYVSQLSKRFVHPALVAAAYNAGPAVTLQWAAQYGSLPVDLFVESLPYKETRAYVKQVVADLYLYQLFYGVKADGARLPMTLPAPSPAGIDF
ncbi:MAG: transglycosylase SLT domain-containing protein [Myxococcaceae bacterium]